MADCESQYTRGGTARGAYCPYSSVTPTTNQVTRNDRAQHSPLPWGAVRVRWAADEDFDERETYVWSVLKPCDFNRNVHLGWRFDAEQLAKDRAT